MRLTKHFTLRELTFSQTAERFGIDNVPDEKGIRRLRYLCQNILEPCRWHFGPIRVSSGYRSPELNEKIRGSDKSQHTLCEAADFEAVHPDVSNYELAEWIKDNLEFDQLILELYRKGDPKSGWVHCSVGPRERREVLTYTNRRYLKGLQP